MGLASDAFSGPYLVYSALVDSDLVFVPAVADDGESGAGHAGVDRRAPGSPIALCGAAAWESYADGYLGVRNTLAANLATNVKQACSRRACAATRRRCGSLSAANVPVEVFDNLIAAFEANLPTWHRYWALRRGIARRRAAVAFRRAHPSARPRRLPYEQCVEWICASLAPLGDPYVETVRRGCLEERWVDV